MKKMKELNDLLLHQLQDLYDAEHQITEALPQMVEAASSEELKAAFQEHLNQTEEQINRLKQVFQMLNKRAQRVPCKGMQGLIEEGSELMKEQPKGQVLDAGLIASAQKVEHYEVAAYGSARTYAYQLGYQDAAQLLQQTLDEEEMTDKKLTQIAGRVNVEAMKQ
ncbi:MAG: ferritin-like domain-containing protein [Chloroflexi bacterium]|nr:ferritin-like domain-containing protein [Chloroflexota bacterium]